jgi:hypothetical protein
MDRYYASWVAGLAAVGVVLLLAADGGARHVLDVLVTIVVILARCGLAVGLALLPV